MKRRGRLGDPEGSFFERYLRRLEAVFANRCGGSHSERASVTKDMLLAQMLQEEEDAKTAMNNPGHSAQTSSKKGCVVKYVLLVVGEGWFGDTNQEDEQ